MKKVVIKLITLAAILLSVAITSCKEDKQTPVADDFYIRGTGTFAYDGNPKQVIIKPRLGKSNGKITVYYDSSTSAPSEVGSYIITFDVAATIDFDAAMGLSSGTIIITSNACQIVSFRTPDKSWDISGRYISATFDAGTDVTALTPTIVVSENADYVPKGPQDFSKGDVQYIVTAEDGITTQEYIVTAIVEKSNACEIISFSTPDKIWNISEKNITATFTEGTKVTALTPTIVVSENANYLPKGAQDFSKGSVKFTVIAEDGITTQEYTATAIVEECIDCEVIIPFNIGVNPGIGVFGNSEVRVTDKNTYWEIETFTTGGGYPWVTFVVDGNCQGGISATITFEYQTLDQLAPSAGNVLLLFDIPGTGQP
jgi:hypothetical protein